MAQNQKLTFIIDAENNAEGALKGVSKSIDAVQNKVESLKPSFTKMAAVGTAAFIGITAVVKKSTMAYAEAERATRQLENAVIKISKGTKEQVKVINDVSEALQKKAGIDADALKMGAAQLSTFGLQSKSVVDLTKSLADLTVNQNGVNASSDDYIASANTIAKALNGQFGILEKSGIRFTEHQQQLILTGTETQKVAALQEGLNQNLRETTDTIAGVDLATAQYQRTMGEIQESIGKALIPVLTELSKAILPIIERFATWAEANPEQIEKIVQLGLVIAGLTAALGVTGLAAPAIITGIRAVGTALMFLASNPVIVLGAAIATLFIAFHQLVKETGSVHNAFIEIGNNIIKWWKASGEWIYDKIEKLVKLAERAASFGLIGSVVKLGKTVVNAVDGKRAAGGPVSAGKSYLVGENGPEMFTPGAYGRITNSKGMGGGGIQINISGNNFLGPDDLADKVGDAIINKLKFRTKLSF